MKLENILQLCSWSTFLGIYVFYGFFGSATFSVFGPADLAVMSEAGTMIFSNIFPLVVAYRFDRALVLQKCESLDEFMSLLDTSVTFR